jgi:hypothetical protein
VNGPLLAMQEVDEFTRDTQALQHLLVANGEGNTKLIIRPYIPNINVKLSMFAHSSTFAGGQTAISSNTNQFDRIYDPITDEFIAVGHVAIEMPTNEKSYCFSYALDQHSSHGTAVGASLSVNGVGYKFSVEKAVVPYGRSGVLVIHTDASEGDSIGVTGKTDWPTLVKNDFTIDSEVHRYELPFNAQNESGMNRSGVFDADWTVTNSSTSSSPSDILEAKTQGVIKVVAVGSIVYNDDRSTYPDDKIYVPVGAVLKLKPVPTPAAEPDAPNLGWPENEPNWDNNELLSPVTYVVDTSEPRSVKFTVTCGSSSQSVTVVVIKATFTPSPVYMETGGVSIVHVRIEPEDGWKEVNFGWDKSPLTITPKNATSSEMNLTVEAMGSGLGGEGEIYALVVPYGLPPTSICGSAPVKVVKMYPLNLVDSDYPVNRRWDNTDSDETPQAPPANPDNRLTLWQYANGKAKIKIEMYGKPQAQDAFPVRWKLEKNGGGNAANWSKTEGVFATDMDESEWQDANPDSAQSAENRDFQVTAWVDFNNNSQWDAGEPHRRLYVSIGKLNKLKTWSDSNPAEFKEDSTSDDATPANPDDRLVIWQDAAKSAKLKLEQTWLSVDADGSQIKWRIDAADGWNKTTGDFSKGAQEELTWTEPVPANNREYQLVVWADKNGNDQFDAGEQRRKLCVTVATWNIQWSGDGRNGIFSGPDALMPQGSDVTLTAVSVPPYLPLPPGKPVWGGSAAGPNNNGKTTVTVKYPASGMFPVTAECFSTVTGNVISVGIDYLEYSAAGAPWRPVPVTLEVDPGAEVSFRAIPTPGAIFPPGWPIWTLDNNKISVGSSVNVPFSLDGQYSLISTCGTSKAEVSIITTNFTLNEIQNKAQIDPDFFYANDVHVVQNEAMNWRVMTNHDGMVARRAYFQVWQDLWGWDQMVASDYTGRVSDAGGVSVTIPTVGEHYAWVWKDSDGNSDLNWSREVYIQANFKVVPLRIHTFNVAVSTKVNGSTKSDVSAMLSEATMRIKRRDTAADRRACATFVMGEYSTFAPSTVNPRKPDPILRGSSDYSDLVANVTTDIRIVTAIVNSSGDEVSAGLTRLGQKSTIVLAAGHDNGVCAHEIGHGVGINGDYADGEPRGRIMWQDTSSSMDILELNSECDAYEK